MSHRNRQTYTREFKLDAISQVTEVRSTYQVEKDLGIGRGCVAHWLVEFANVQGGQPAFPGKGTPRDEEMAKLQRENAILRQDREILKKALGILNFQLREHARFLGFNEATTTHVNLVVPHLMRKQTRFFLKRSRRSTTFPAIDTAVPRSLWT